MNNEHISLIIPAYNEERHLGACLDSVAAQTIQPFEVIVVDNNSSDATAKVAACYPFVRVLYEPRQGVVYARDAGFDAAQGNIIARIDADTRLPADWIARIEEFYTDDSHADYALTGGGYFYNVRLPKLNGWIQGQLAFRANRFMAGHYILWGSNMAFKAKQWQRVKPNLCHRQDIHEDMDLAIHLHEQGYQIAYHESLRVGVLMKRIWSHKSQLHEHIARWPRTLRVHHVRLWWFAVIGNIFLLYFVRPFFYCAEWIARLCGRESFRGR